MTISHRLWTAMESVPDLAAPRLEWRGMLERDYDSTDALLRERDELGEVVLVQDRVMRVVVHAPDRVMLVPEEGGRATPVEAREVKVCDLDIRNMLARTRNALAIQAPGTKSRDAGTQLVVGRLLAGNGRSCVVYICRGENGTGPSDAISKTLAATDGPVVVLTPNALSDREAGLMLRSHRACHISLEEAIDISPDGVWRATAFALQSLDAYRKELGSWSEPTLPTEAYEFRRLGQVWSISFEGLRRQIPQRSAGGLKYIQQLLRCRNLPIGVVDLEKATVGDPRVLGAHVGQPIVQNSELRKIRDELGRIDTDLDRARRESDLARVYILTQERVAVLSHLSRMRGLRGDPRPLGDESDKLRSKITQAIRRSFKIIDDSGLPACAEHLYGTIRTGTVMIYASERDLHWSL